MVACILPIHPGKIFAEELGERGLSGSSAARALGVPQSRVSNIPRRRTGITADTARRLGRWLGTGPEQWINMQKDYELRLAEAASGSEILQTVEPIAATHASVA